MFTMTLEGVDELAYQFERGIETMADAVAGAVERACLEGADEARRTHAYQDRTGALTGSIHGRVEVKARGGAAGIIEATAAYASFVDEGTRPHEIRPKASSGTFGPLQAGQTRRTRAEARGLRARNRAAGRGAVEGGGFLAWQAGPGDWHFARVVHHPGTRPDGFMGRAYLKAERVLEREVELAAERLSLAISRAIAA